MAFNSYIFILAFLPVCTAGYFLLNKVGHYTISKYFIIAMSLLFYAWANPMYLLILIPSILINYGAYLLIKKDHKKCILTAAIVVNVLILLYFKYCNFFIENINRIFASDFATKNIILPLGISFITFQQLSFIIDAYHGEVKDCSLPDYIFLVTYFPHILSGPILMPDEFLPQINDASRKKLNWENMSKGIFLFSLGLAKKVLIADVFGAASDFGFAAGLNSSDTLLSMLAYTLQIYFDFSGYCDMAMGVSKMLNFDLPLNFNSPYKAISIPDFWKRWHMTLTRFLTKYIYIPLGGNRKGKLRTYLNILIVYLVSGFWHGASWTFVIWGVLHGVLTIIYRQFKSFFEKLPKFINRIITFLMINFTWVFFRASSLTDAVSFFKKLFAFDFGPVSVGIRDAFCLTEIRFVLTKFWILTGFDALGHFPFLPMAAYFILAMILVLFVKNATELSERFKRNAWTAILSAVLIVWCVFSLAGVGVFLYFNF